MFRDAFHMLNDKTPTIKRVNYSEMLGKVLKSQFRLRKMKLLHAIRNAVIIKAINRVHTVWLKCCQRCLI